MPLSMSLAAVLQHVQVLEASGLVRSQKTGRTRTCTIEPAVVRSAESWIAERRDLCERRLDRLGEYLANTLTTRRGLSATPRRCARSARRSECGFCHSRHVHDRADVPGATSRVFAAFASAEAKGVWGDTGNLERADGEAGVSEFDFRAGGRERFGFKMAGTTFRYDARYYDVVPDQRIVYTYEMYADDARISVSVATIEFAKSEEGTALTWTEQGTYLDGIDGPEAPPSARKAPPRCLTA